MKVLVYGSDYYLGKEYISSITKQKGDARYVSTESECENAITQLFQKSLFGDSETPVFYDVHDFVEDNIEKLVKSNESWIIWECVDKIPYKAKTKDILLANATVKQIISLSDREIEKWLQNKVKEYGLSISMPNVQYIASLHDNDLLFLEHELQKLFWYTNKGSRGVTVQDIDLLSDPTKEGNIFSLMDSIGSRYMPAVARACCAIQAKNIDEWQLFYMTTRHVRLLLQTKVGGTVNVPAFVQQKLSKQAAQWKTNELISVLERLSQEEYNVKSGRAHSLFPGYVSLMMTVVCSSGI